MENLLFVYGTLQRGFDNPYARMIAKQGHLLGRASMQGLLYDAGEYPCAVYTDQTTAIWGEVYHFDNPDAILPSLDKYEGDEYERKLVDIHFNENTITAWAYFYTADLTDLQPIPHGDYKKHITAGR